MKAFRIKPINQKVNLHYPISFSQKTKILVLWVTSICQKEAVMNCTVDGCK